MMLHDFQGQVKSSLAGSALVFQNSLWEPWADRRKSGHPEASALQRPGAGAPVHSPC